MHRILDGAGAILLNATIIAGQQHGPFRQRDEDGIVHLELDRQLDLAAIVVITDGLDIRRHLAQHRRVFVGVESRHLEVGGQRDLQHVDLFIRRPKGLRVRAAQRHQSRIEFLPDGGISVA